MFCIIYIVYNTIDERRKNALAKVAILAISPKTSISPCKKLHGKVDQLDQLKAELCQLGQVGHIIFFVDVEKIRGAENASDRRVWRDSAKKWTAMSGQSDCPVIEENLSHFLSGEGACVITAEDEDLTRYILIFSGQPVHEKHIINLVGGLAFLWKSKYQIFIYQ